MGVGGDAAGAGVVLVNVVRAALRQEIYETGNVYDVGGRLVHGVCSCDRY